ncbi:heavy metal-associated isoprenylated plant protein 12-like [Solanum pennellii]|uniref:Heavy metal-associated isoprenylated plant protein 12-like n=1 Tax=Solanum pennellii TaxID=28526 RepID=A0ABM1H0E5_SOLPN|nr:heavy metal-associated isoprenylated plant protein 12-like [Solanum pennellii]
MMKVVLKLEYVDEKIKQKVMKKVSVVEGVDSMSIDTKDKKLTVIGNVDPVVLVSKLKKLCHTEIVLVGPAKEPEKKKDNEPKKTQDKKKAAIKAYPAPVLYQYQPYPQYPTPVPAYQHYYSVEEEDSNSCVIC